MFHRIFFYFTKWFTITDTDINIVLNFIDKQNCLSKAWRLSFHWFILALFPSPDLDWNVFFVIKHYKTAHIDKLRIYMYTVKNFFIKLKKRITSLEKFELYMYHIFLKLRVKPASSIYWLFYRLNHLIFIDHSSKA